MNWLNFPTAKAINRVSGNNKIHEEADEIKIWQILGLKCLFRCMGGIGVVRKDKTRFHWSVDWVTIWKDDLDHPTLIRRAPEINRIRL